MDAYEATKIVLSKIQSLDPENASKIMGFLLIQDHGEKEIIRLAFGPESLIQSVVVKARKELGISSNNSSAPSTPSSSPSPFLSNGRGNPLSRQNSTRLSVITNSLSNSREDLLISPSFNSTSSSSMNSSAPPFYGSGAAADLIDELQIQEQLSFLNDGVKNPDFFYANQNWPGIHRRSFSVSDVCVGSDDPSGFGWKPCLYYARGYCKNGTSCRFLHGGIGDSAGDGSAVGSPTKFEMIAAASSFPQSPSSLANKCANFLLHQQQGDSPRGYSALMMGEEMHKFGRNRVIERSDLTINGNPGMINPISRQIYLTFPADSTFREEDVSIYFSIYGPVQDVRIPYQQKRMFGFVTFVYPETVKLILAKGNPHFVCDARVLVKPYKEKGKIPDKLRKGDYSVCGSPTGLDSRDPFDIPIGPRMFSSSHELLWRRKLEEEADLQQALEIEAKRLMGLQILDLKRQTHQRALSAGAGAGLPSPTSHFCSPTVSLYSDQFNPKVTQMNCFNPSMADEKSLTIITSSNEESESPESCSSSLEHNLPDSPFASPKASSGAGDYVAAFLEEEESSVAAATTTTAVETNNNKNMGSLVIPSSFIPSSAQSDLSVFNSWHFQVPRRLSSGNGAIGM